MKSGTAVALVALALGLAVPVMAAEGQAGPDPVAIAKLRRMTDDLARLQRFSVRATASSKW